MMYNKWGAVVILLIVFGTIAIVVLDTGANTSTLFSNKYTPKRVVILENHPIRIIWYGETEEDINMSNLLRGIHAMNDINHTSGKFNNSLDITFGLNLMGEQIRGNTKLEGILNESVK